MAFEYIHKDGRTGISDRGCWFAMTEALGKPEANEVVDLSKQGFWQPIKPIQTENGTHEAPAGSRGFSISRR